MIFYLLVENGDKKCLKNVADLSTSPGLSARAAIALAVAQGEVRSSERWGYQVHKDERVVGTNVAEITNPDQQTLRRLPLQHMLSDHTLKDQLRAAISHLQANGWNWL